MPQYICAWLTLASRVRGDSDPKSARGQASGQTPKRSKQSGFSMVGFTHGNIAPCFGGSEKRSYETLISHLRRGEVDPMKDDFLILSCVKVVNTGLMRESQQQQQSRRQQNKGSKAKGSRARAASGLTHALLFLEFSLCWAFNFNGKRDQFCYV